jgi:Tol biopolymer transport system component
MVVLRRSRSLGLGPVLSVLVLALAQGRAEAGTRYAFLIACSGYDRSELKPLPYTVNDIVEFKKALRETGFDEDHIVVMHDGLSARRFLSEGTKIRKELALFLAGMGPEDTVVVALSGHGVHFKGDATGYFCPVDAQLGDKRTLLPLDGPGSLFEILKACKAGRKLLLVNACRNDPTSDAAQAADKVNLDDDYPEEVPEGIAALYSCRKTEKSYYDDERRRGIFFLHAAEAWRGAYQKPEDGSLHLEQFFKEVCVRTKADAYHTFAKPQNPQVRREYKGLWVVVERGRASVDTTGGYRFVHFGSGVVQVALTSNSERKGLYFARVYNLQTGEALSPPLRHTHPVYHASFSPDGRYLLTVSGKLVRTFLTDKWEARVWEVQTGKGGKLLNHDDSIWYAAFSPDGTQVITSSKDGTARVWNARGGEEVQSFKHESSGVLHAEFSPDGRYVVTASTDGTARVWNVGSGGPKTRPLKHNGAVAHAAFSRDGRLVVTCGVDNTARIWEVETGNEVKSFAHEGGRAKSWIDGVMYAAFSPDGQYVATASLVDGVRVWEVAAGRESQRSNYPGSFFRAVFSPDGKRLVATGGGMALLWERDSGKKVRLEPKTGRTNGVAFSPDGQSVVTSSDDGTAREWDAKTGQERHKVTVSADKEGRGDQSHEEGSRRSDNPEFAGGSEGKEVARPEGGLEIRSVASESPAGKQGLRPEDVILKVDERQVGSYEDWVAALTPGEHTVTYWAKQKRTVRRVVLRKVEGAPVGIEVRK